MHLAQLRPLLIAGLTGILAASAAAQQDVPPDRVLVVVSDASSISQLIGNYYAQVRGIPSDHILHLKAATPITEEIDRTTYNRKIRDPLLEFFDVTRPDLKDYIKYIVLTKEIPHKVLDSGTGTTNQSASVDSELTQLYTGNVGTGGQSGRIANPFFATYHSPMNWSHADSSYMVFRLDGYQTNPDPGTGIPADVKRLIDDALNPANHGQVLLDAPAATGQGNDWIVQAAGILTNMSFPNVLDTTGTFQSNWPDLLGYVSWGSNDGANPGVPYYGEVPPGSGNFYPGFWNPGAITTDYVSTSARTYFDGNQNYGQSLEADLIRNGVAGTNGHVYEPYLDACARPQYLFPHYFQGLQAGLSYYQSIRYLSWMNVVVVDPLMKSSVTAPVAPRFTDISPTRVASGTSANFAFHGDFFTSEEDTVATLGGVAFTNLYIPTPIGASGDCGPLPPGLLDFTLTTFMGSSTFPKVVISTPAIDLTGTVDVGSTLSLSLYGTTGDTFLIFVSLGTASIDLPPFGTLGLDPTQHFALVGTGVLPSDQLDLSGDIPNDPNLHGVTFYIQNLQGPDLATKDMKFSNVVTVAIP